MISPIWNTKFNYLLEFHKKLDLDNPDTFYGKICWLKLNLYNNSNLVKQCADKYKVREYISSIGYSDILNGIIGVYDDPDEIKWNELPNRFVIKWNFGAGFNIVCDDKEKLDINHTIRQLKKWKRNKYWLPFSEMQYNIPKKLLIEEFLHDENQKFTSLTDYKVYCFYGNPVELLVINGREAFSHKLKREFFDANWIPLESHYEASSEPTPKPDCLERMLEAASYISKPFPFVRIDFYVVNEKLYFGEMTFTPAGGLYTSYVPVHGQDLSKYISIPALIKADECKKYI